MDKSPSFSAAVYAQRKAAGKASLINMGGRYMIRHEADPQFIDIDPADLAARRAVLANELHAIDGLLKEIEGGKPCEKDKNNGNISPRKD